MHQDTAAWPGASGIRTAVRAHLPTAATCTRSPNVSRYTPLDQGARQGGHLHSELGFPSLPHLPGSACPAPPPRLSPLPATPPHPGHPQRLSAYLQYVRNATGREAEAYVHPSLPLTPHPLSPLGTHTHTVPLGLCPVRPRQCRQQGGRSLRVQHPCGAGRGVGCGAEGLSGKGSNADRDQGGRTMVMMMAGGPCRLKQMHSSTLPETVISVELQTP